MDSKVLEIKDLKIHYFTEDGEVLAVEGVNLGINEGETLGLVGETGAGKTTTALGIMQLVAEPPGKIVGGEILFKGDNLLKYKEKDMRKLRGNEISMIFQDPMTSLNPVLTIGEQLIEVIQLHQKLDKSKSIAKAKEMLEMVGLPGERLYDYPHEFSGGMKQRVVIAICLACNPKLLIADEPTTALDVTIQAQVLEIMKRLKDEYQMTMLMITHDLGIVAEICDNVAIMYAGRIVELSDKKSLFTDPKHPYTVGLFDSLPSIKSENKKPLNPIKGLIPDPIDLPSGCIFHPRCSDAWDRCEEEIPKEYILSDKRRVSCFKYEDQCIKSGGKTHEQTTN
ncbi:oligopeptide/dipeptide ABC transporter, ATPase subunit [Alkaliphilus metalliredigens QYMF]|uniref:Oligopeptide/dipeptide ABC transporter, ATPase subunit n=1 Tax=Alkaliphilus metalliredigens (strain QYMF) TaxID=293826 RepID=A6TPC6_ALKMQ|nr:ABC transporter ATP-binding protein [Alkaliphilus metalliredigens]ABR48044.1 oligopeptide/dipeptide ABC transporter, ATPase subunit [Alkaliphilus metalliredigens QYMF]